MSVIQDHRKREHALMVAGPIQQKANAVLMAKEEEAQLQDYADEQGISLAEAKERVAQDAPLLASIRARPLYQFHSLAELDSLIDDIVIPDELKDGKLWTFRLIPDGHFKKTSEDFVTEFYDYRYCDPIYCDICDDQYRYPQCYFVRYVGPGAWQTIWACPFGHPHEHTWSDHDVKDHLRVTPHGYRLMEDGHGETP